MRRSLAVIVSFPTAFIAAAAGCTFLIPFDAPPPFGPDATVEDAAARPADSGSPIPAEWTTDFPLNDVDCSDQPRPNCAKNTIAIVAYPADASRENDLVRCEGTQRPTAVKHCPNGCAIMPDQRPDECDPCLGKEDGYYCGRALDLTPENADVYVECINGHARETERPGECARVCAGKKCTSCPDGCD